MRHFNLHAIAHITGGGLIENIPRVLPSSMKAILKYPQLGLASNFSVVAKKRKSYRPRNGPHLTIIGVGMILCVASKDADKILDLLLTLGEKA
ncbi:AIR synthase-related protein [Candidatus Coxiella mudrowiae]|uniref:AIR synthase-related protein n=1 Tax=Candidatus Coxiella mudrowiae TaxID=2054173 RepID=UPI003CC82F26